MNKINVVFRVLEGDPIALFPELVDDVAGKYITSYMRVGQHSGAHPELVGDLPRATPEQYGSLLGELRAIYDDCELVVEEVA